MAQLVIEPQLMQVIPTLLTRDAVDDFSDEYIETLVSESEGTIKDRDRNKEKLAILNQCLGDIKGLLNRGCKFDGSRIPHGLTQ
jgi:hypothetical protein